jgi:hypothetical protein
LKVASWSRTSRREENPTSKNEQHDANERKVGRGGNHESGIGLPHSTTSRTEWQARISRQSRGRGRVRQPYAALTSVHWQAMIDSGKIRQRNMEPPYVGCYEELLSHFLDLLVRSWARHRQFDGEFAAFSRLALHYDSAAVSLNNMFHNT